MQTEKIIQPETLDVVEIKAFVPARNFGLSKQFYQDIGFTLASDMGGVAYFYRGSSSFLLQDFYNEAQAKNFMMHLLVADVAAWHQELHNQGISSRYQVAMSNVVEQPWGMREFTLCDPSGVLWRIAQNI